MPDRFTETRRVSYGGRLANSAGGVFMGFLIFLASFGVLYWNEGRVDISRIAKSAVELTFSVAIDPVPDGRLVSVTDVVSSTDLLSDNLFLNPDKFIALERTVEMFAWKETKEETTKTDFGGGETIETTYTYTKDWQEKPQSSSSFRIPEEHENPSKSLESYSAQATSASIGPVSFDPRNIHLPNFSKLELDSKNVTLNGGGVLAGRSFIFIKKSSAGSFENPEIGDLRVSYKVLRPGFSGTIFGQLNGNYIEQYVDEKGNELFRLFAGSRATAIEDLHVEYTVVLWLFRLLGLFMMWMGLNGLLGPASVLLSFLPFLGSLSKMLISIATMIVSIILTSVTILVSMIAHNIIALVIALVIVIGVIIYFLRKKKTAVVV